MVVCRICNKITYSIITVSTGDSLKTESLKYENVDKIESWMDLMKEDLIGDYNIRERKIEEELLKDM
jgi:hypothetical protein